MSLNDRLRPVLGPIGCAIATPVSIVAHCILYPLWWLLAPESAALVIALSLEAIVIGLIIIDKQNQDAARDHEWQREVFSELLDKVPGARPEIAETDG